jgi:hypothetical protein
MISFSLFLIVVVMFIRALPCRVFDMDTMRKWSRYIFLL